MNIWLFNVYLFFVLIYSMCGFVKWFIVRDSIYMCNYKCLVKVIFYNVMIDWNDIVILVIVILSNNFYFMCNYLYFLYIYMIIDMVIEYFKL